MVCHARPLGNDLFADTSFLCSRDPTAVSLSRLLSRLGQKKSFMGWQSSKALPFCDPPVIHGKLPKTYSLPDTTGGSRLLRDTSAICEDFRFQFGSSTPKRAATCAAVQSSVVTGRSSSRHALRPPSRTHTFVIPLRRNKTAVRALVI
jgi:hypothetical protein